MPKKGLSLSPYHREPSSSDPTCHQVPLPEEIQASPGDTEIHRVEPEDVANHLTAFHWELFRCVHEVRLKLMLGRECAPGSLLLQWTSLARRLTHRQYTLITLIGRGPLIWQNG